MEEKGFFYPLLSMWMIFVFILVLDASDSDGQPIVVDDSLLLTVVDVVTRATPVLAWATVGFAAMLLVSWVLRLVFRHLSAAGRGDHIPNIGSDR